MNILTFTTLYPNERQPHHGVFVENRIRHTMRSGSVSFRVVAPVPFFPVPGRVFGRYSQFAGIGARETRFGVEIAHPRYPVVPKIGMHLAPILLYLFSRRAVRDAALAGKTIDVLDAHYFYPDGVAAAMLAAELDKPLVITARGTDINLIPGYALPRRMILWAARRASTIVAVCQALKLQMVELGVDAEKIVTIRNGVDLRTFRILVDDSSTGELRSSTAPTLLSVGHLIPRKGHDLVIRALAKLPDARLLIVGDGPLRQSLKKLARQERVDQRVRFLGSVAHDELVRIYNAANILVLASDREGWPNVLLEAMACGTPVVATAVWGTPEVVRQRSAGVLVDQRTPDAIASAIGNLLASLPPREETRAYAEAFSWDHSAAKQIDLFSGLASAKPKSAYHTFHAA